MEISRNLSKQPFPTDSGRITLKNPLRDYVHLLKSSDFRLLVLKCAGSYSRVYTVLIAKLKIDQFASNKCNGYARRSIIFCNVRQ